MKFEKITKSFAYKNGLNVKLLNDISIELEVGKINTILASVGSGKSTLLKILCGLETDDSNEKIENKCCFIPSKPSSFPWLNVTENIVFGSENIGAEHIKSLINLVGLEGYDAHYPNDKSLGFRFRIALARCLAVKPEMVVLDEPFLEMDQRTKFEVLQLLVDINIRTKTTFLFATSNLSEALLISNNIFLMKKGSIGPLQSQKIEYPTYNIMERLNSKAYSLYLADEENLAKSLASQQSFIISL